MKVKSAKASKKEAPSLKSSGEKKERYEVEEISNGFIISKTWTDEKYNYHCVKTYSATNPLADKIK